MITTAPPIETLATLNHVFRHVATQDTETGGWIWHGDLSIPLEHKLYRIMRDEHQTVVQLSHKPRSGATLLFAAIAKRIDPTTAYDAAVRFRDGEQARNDMARLIKANARRRLIA